MTVRASPTELQPTHHVVLRDRAGVELGLILCDEQGQPQKNASSFVKNPIDTTALKQTSGSSSYDIFDYPYSPIVQDDLSGGRGSLDFERDSTKYYDSFRAKTGRSNKAYAGPQEQYCTGVRSLNQNMPGSVKWHTLTGEARYLYKRFAASASYTAALAWLLVRIKGEPGDLTVAIHADSTGDVGTQLTSITVAYTRMNDVLSEWLCETISQALVTSTYYWIIVNAASTDNTDNHWKIGVKASTGTTYYSETYDTTPTGADYDLYYRVTAANATKTCVPFQYKEAQYFVINAASGAPALYIAGDRGSADANTGNLDRLIDATKSWTVNEHVGKLVQIIGGPGSAESEPWRTVVSNTATDLVVSPNWEIEHTTATDYVIQGDTLREITGHGLTAPVTDVLVSTTYVIYFAMSNATTVRRAKFENSAGTWTATYADETATTKADLFEYMPEADKIILLSNSDASANVSLAVMSNAGGPPAWGTALTWATVINVGDKYRRIMGTEVYPDASNNEAIWIFKEDGVYSHDAGTGKPTLVSLKEFANVRSKYAGKKPLHHGVYLYFPLQYGLERYYGNQYDDVGPNLNEGLPTNRRGPIVDMVGYPGKFFVAIDAGATGYSSLLDSDGWHERYRAPKGQRITALSFQTIPGSTLERLWVYQGNDLVWIPFPSETPNELEDSNYLYTHEFAVMLSRMHAGIFDVQKLVKLIKLQTENLSVDSDNVPVCWFEMDYRLDGDTDWTPFDEVFTTSPTQGIDLTPQFGLAGRRLQFRVRGYTTDGSQSPVLLAIIVNAVLRTDVKYMYPLVFRLMDNETLLSGEYDTQSAADKLQILEDWADSSSDSMLYMNSISPLYDGKMVFLNPPTTRQARFKTDQNNEFTKDVYICNATVQEA